MIREMEYIFFTETILDCSASKILNSILYIIVRHMKMLEIYRQTYNKTDYSNSVRYRFKMKYKSEKQYNNLFYKLHSLKLPILKCL